MRRVNSIFVLLVAGSSYGVDLQKTAKSDLGNQVGVGLAFSGLTGLSVYADTSTSKFLQAELGFAPSGAYQATGDYAFGYRNAVSTLPSVTPYWGLGAVLLHNRSEYWAQFAPKDMESRTYVGARIPMGANFEIPRTPVQLSAEIAPSLLVIPETHIYVQGRVSVRVLF